MGTQAEEILALLQKPGVLTEGLRRKLLELLLPPMENPYVPYEEFLARADEDTLAEWVQVEIHPYSPASRSHQDIAGFLYGLLRAYVERHRLGVVLPAPFQMKLSRSGREPDLLFVAQEHLHRLHPTHLEGPADLVVEIVSPESAPRDRGEKFFPNTGSSTPRASGPSSISGTSGAAFSTRPRTPRGSIAPRSSPDSGCGWTGSGRTRCRPWI